MGDRPRNLETGRYKHPWLMLPRKYRRIARGAYGLIQSAAPEYAAMGTWIPWIVKDDIPSLMATDGANLFFKHGFLEGLNPHDARHHKVLAWAMAKELIHLGHKHNERRDEKVSWGGSADRYQIASDGWCNIALRYLFGPDWRRPPGCDPPRQMDERDFRKSVETLYWNLRKDDPDEDQKGCWYEPKPDEPEEEDGEEDGDGVGTAGEGSPGSSDSKPDPGTGKGDSKPQKATESDSKESGEKDDPWWKKPWKSWEPPPPPKQRWLGDLMTTSEEAEEIPSLSELLDPDYKPGQDGDTDPRGPMGDLYAGLGEGAKVKMAAKARFRRRPRKALLSTKSVRGLLGQMLPSYAKIQIHGMANGFVLPRLMPRGARVAIVLDTSGSMAGEPGMRAAQDLVRACGYGDELIGVIHSHQVDGVCKTTASLPRFFGNAEIGGGTQVADTIELLEREKVDAVVWVTDCQFGDILTASPKFATLFVVPRSCNCYPNLQWERSRCELFG